jgi:hypothetical protein
MDHPNIVKAIEVYKYKKQIYLILQVRPVLPTDDESHYGLPFPYLTTCSLFAVEELLGRRPLHTVALLAEEC